MSPYNRFNIAELRPALDYCFIHACKLPSGLLSGVESTQTGERGQRVSHCSHYTGQLYRFVITIMCLLRALNLLLRSHAALICTFISKLGGSGNKLKQESAPFKWFIQAFSQMFWAALNRWAVKHNYATISSRTRIGFKRQHKKTCHKNEQKIQRHD